MARPLGTILRDNFIGIDDDYLTPGEKFGRLANAFGSALMNPIDTAKAVVPAMKQDLDYLMFEGGAEREPARVIEYATGAAAPGTLARTLAGAPDPTTLSANPLPEFGNNGGPRVDLLREALDARAAQMDIPTAKRPQADPNRLRIVDTDYLSPPDVDVTGGVNLADKYPRNPDPDARLPLNDRARVLVDRRSELAEALAERIRGTGQMDMPTRYFYHSDGPLWRAAKNAGLTDEEATAWLQDFGKNFAATSPRTKVEPNTLNATLAMTKQARGVPHRELVGPGQPVDPKTGERGLSERGYPMIANEGSKPGLHGILLDRVHAGEEIGSLTNPKPSTFAGNTAGNRSGATIDTHAIRATLQTLNELEPGAVPIEFIEPKFKEQYLQDPLTLTPNMIKDTLGSQMVGPRGATQKMQTEYPIFADIWHDAADILGVSPAEAQSMGWFGFGEDTNLGSDLKTVADVFDERINVTSQIMGMSPEEVARRVFRREMPLLSVGGAPLPVGYSGQAPVAYGDDRGPGA